VKLRRWSKWPASTSAAVQRRIMNEGNMTDGGKLERENEPRFSVSKSIRQKFIGMRKCFWQPNWNMFPNLTSPIQNFPQLNFICILAHNSKYISIIHKCIHVFNRVSKLIFQHKERAYIADYWHYNVEVNIWT
jgi:hypothetical protein